MERYSVNGKMYVVMEVNAPDGKWMATCPADGDMKHWAETREKLLSSIGIPLDATQASSRIVLWAHGPVTYYSDGVIDVKTPFARFKLTFKAYTGGKKRIPQEKFFRSLSGEFDEAFDELNEDLRVGYYRVALKKVRIPGVIDIEVGKAGVNPYDRDYPGIGRALSNYFTGIKGNPTIDTYYNILEHRDSRWITEGRSSDWAAYTPSDEDALNTKLYFAVGSALNFLDSASDGEGYFYGGDEDLGYNLFKDGFNPQDLATKLRNFADALEKSCIQTF